MTYFQRVKLGFSWNKGIFSLIWKYLEEVFIGISALGLGVFSFLKAIFLLITSPLQFFFMPFWAAYKHRENDVFWDNVKKIVEKK